MFTSISFMFIILEFLIIINTFISFLNEHYVDFDEHFCYDVLKEHIVYLDIHLVLLNKFGGASIWTTF